MTQEEKEKISAMTRDGMKARQISDDLGLSVNTVRSFIRRHGAAANGSACAECGKPLVQTSGHRQKRFCSDVCRARWWKAHPEQGQRKAYYRLNCQHCGKEYVSYGNRNRKYCSRECYLNACRKQRFVSVDCVDRLTGVDCAGPDRAEEPPACQREISGASCQSV